MERIKPHLKKVGRFLFQHSEKMILGLALLFLVYVAVQLLLGIKPEKNRLSQIRATLKNTSPGGKELQNNPDLDFKRYIDNDGKENLDEMKDQLAKGHRVFNPDVWKRLSNRVVRIRSGDEFGLGAMAITNITPYYLRIKPEHKRTGQGTSQYRLTVQDEFVYKHYASGGRENLFLPTFTPRLYRGYGLFQNIPITANQPTRVYETIALRYLNNNPRHPNYVGLRVLALNTASMAIELRTNQGTNTFNIPFNRETTILRGYSVGMYYSPAKARYPSRRLGSRLHIDGQNFIILAMEPKPKNVLSSAIRQHPKSVVFALMKTGKEVEIPIRARPPR